MQSLVNVLVRKGDSQAVSHGVAPNGLHNPNVSTSVDWRQPHFGCFGSSNSSYSSYYCPAVYYPIPFINWSWHPHININMLIHIRSRRANEWQRRIDSSNPSVSVTADADAACLWPQASGTSVSCPIETPDKPFRPGIVPLSILYCSMHLSTNSNPLHNCTGCVNSKCHWDSPYGCAYYSVSIVPSSSMPFIKESTLNKPRFYFY